jgi:DivIVA domain-containing protein
MLSAFKKVAKGKFGYEPAEVDAFILRARDQYNNVSAQILDWRDITAQKFTLIKGGYDVAAVDIAIDKLQDTFAERELSRKSNPFAPSLSGPLLTELRGLLLSRASRPKNRKFSRVGVMSAGYSRKEVDALLFVVQEFLEGEDELAIDEVRSLTFKAQRGGYFESQVDAYIERLVEYLQTLKFGEPSPVSPVPTYGFGSTGHGESSGPSQPSGPYSEYE